MPGWVTRSVQRRLAEGGAAAGPEVAVDTVQTARRAGDEVGSQVESLLASDIDAQTTTPLAILRQAVSYPAGVLARAGVAPVERDRFALGAFPDDDYGLTPGSWADVDPALVEPALAWGAAKALAHRRRHHGPA